MDGAPKKKIVLAEDETFLLKVLTDQLQRDGFDVFGAADGVEAIDQIKKNHPDMILLDLIMPNKDGFEVLAEIKNDPATKDIPVIILSNLGQDNDIAQAKKYGVTNYFIKAEMPIHEVVAKVKSILG